MIVRIRLCIPCYDNPATIVQVVGDALQQTSFAVLVVDDGSQEPVQPLLAQDIAAATALETGRLKVLRFPQNRGKGVAIRAAIKDSVALGFTHLLTLDGDGQHLVSEATKLVALAEQFPWDLIIGQRRMEAASVPESSRFGRSFSNFWVKYQTGSKIHDSQSGFRLYPLFHVQCMAFLTRRYEFEIEVLIRLLWKGITVREVEIDVVYPPGDERVSHFRKFIDNVRISLLNTVLVVVSLLRSHRAPREIGFALGLGVMIGCTPLYGLHTLLAAAVAFAFRLNAGYLILGSNISIPPLAPFLVGGSLAMGSYLLTGDATAALALPKMVLAGHSDVHTLMALGSASLKAWTLGSLVIGAALGFLFGVAAFAVAWRLQRRRAVNWTGQTRGGVWGNTILAWVLRTLGLHAGYACLAFLIPYYYVFAPRARRALHEYWATVRPEATGLRRVALVLRHLRRFGQVLMDRVFASSASKPVFNTHPHGMEHILAAAAQERGVILLGAHIGGWDLSIAALPLDGFNERMHVVRFDAEGLTLDKAVSTQAPASGSQHAPTIVSNRAELPVFELHGLLSRGQAVGLMGDRPLSSRYELVPFHGRLAPFDVTPFRIAAATNALLIISFGFKAQGNNYDFYAEPARSYRYEANVDRALQCRQWAQEFAATLQHYLQRYPDQWFNFFSFWSALPTGPQGPLLATNNQLVADYSPATRTPANPATGLATAAEASAAP